MTTIPWKYFGPVEHRLIQCVNTPWLSASQETTKQSKSSENLTSEHPAIVYVNLCNYHCCVVQLYKTGLSAADTCIFCRTTYCWNNASALMKGQNQSSLFGFKRGFNCSQLSVVFYTFGNLLITSENSCE